MQSDYVSTELDSGRLLQRSLLPQSMPNYPGLDIAADVWTAVDLGGDYYQFLEQPGIFGVAIADSSGKSVAGAIHAALFKGQLDAYASQGRLRNPIAVMNSLNQLLCTANTDDAVALAYGVLDLDSYDFQLGNAGIPGPIIYRAETKTCEEIVNPGMALGRFAGITYRTLKRSFAEGDVIIFFSDGLYEAVSVDGTEFGAGTSSSISPLQQTIVRLAHLSAAEILTGLKHTLDQFSDRQVPEDDVSIVVIKLNQKVLLSQIRDCPYQEALQAWMRSDEQDTSALLRGKRLMEARAWAKGQPSLARIDFEFLEESDRINEREQMQQQLLEAATSRAAAADRLEKLSQDLAKSLESEKQHRIQAEMGALSERIAALTMSSEALYLSNNHIEALISSVIGGAKIRQLMSQVGDGQVQLKANTQIRTITALEQVIYGIHETNRFEGHGFWVNKVCFSPDGKLLVSASSDRTIKVWNVNGNLVQTLSGHTNWVTSVAVSPDNKLIASASRDNMVRIWAIDESTGKFRENSVAMLKGHEGPVMDVCFSPNGETIASASEDTTVRLWRPNGTLLKTLRGGHERWVNCVAFNPNGKELVSGSADRTLIIWSINGTLLKTLKGHDSFVETVAFEPRGQAIISGARDRTVKLWGADGALIRTFYGHSEKVWSVAYAPDGKTIASAAWDRTIKIWETDGTLIKTLTGHGDVINSIAFSPDGKSLASASRDTTVKLWNIRGNPLLKITGHTDEVNSAVLSANSELIASGGKDKNLNIWQLNGALVASSAGHNDRIHAVCFSPDGQLIVSASADSSIKMWNTSGKEIDTLNGHRADVYSLSFRSDGQVFASCSADNSVRIWRSDGVWLQTLNGHTSEVYAVCFSPDGSMLATAGRDKIINLWSWNGDLIYTFEGHSAEVFCLCFNPDNNLLASGSMDQSVKIWSTDGALLKTLNGHSAEVRGICFSPDGTTIASASEDTTIQLWSTDGTLLRTFNGHSAAVRSVSFSQDGKTLISAGADHAIILWNLDLDDLLIRGCRWLKEYLRSNINVSDEDRRACLGGCVWLSKFLKAAALTSP
jgi:WD40 repeat protein